jgi:N-acetylglutamate synthase-like GNAT family acetyltransferase
MNSTTENTNPTNQTVTHNTKTENERESPRNDLKNLEFVRLKIPSLIPIDLIEAVKGCTYTAERFIEYQESQIDNPANFLYALIDESRKIHGYLWAELNLLDRSLFVNTVSVYKKYWGKAMGIKKAIDFVSYLKTKEKVERVFWCTTNPRYFEKHGFDRSKNCLMEYNSN